MPPLRSTGAQPEAELPEYAGHYRLEACLGSGGMGVVHLARSASGLQLAVKVVHAEYAGGPRVQGPFPAGGGRRAAGERGVHRARRGRRPGGRTALDGHPVHPRPDPRRAGQAERAAGPGRAAPADGRARRGAARHPPGGRRAPGPQAEQRAARRRTGPKVIDFGISRPTDSELRTETGQADRHAAVHGARAVPAAARGGAGRRRVRAGGGARARGDGARAVRLGQPVRRGLPGRARRAGPDRRAGGSRAAGRRGAWRRTRRSGRRRTS